MNCYHNLNNTMNRYHNLGKKNGYPERPMKCRSRKNAYCALTHVRMSGIMALLLTLVVTGIMCALPSCAYAAQEPEDAALTPVEKYQRALLLVKSSDEADQQQAFTLLTEAADEGVMEACALMGFYHREERNDGNGKQVAHPPG